MNESINNTKVNQSNDSPGKNPLNNKIEDGPVRYVELTNKRCIHNKCKFTAGLNVDFLPFNTHKMCGPGGLYFCKYEDLGKWVVYNNTPMFYLWDVEIPEGEQVVNMGTMLKCHSLILSNKQTLWDNNEICLKAVKQHGGTLQYVKTQTEKLCLEAVKNYGLALQFVNLNGSFFKMNYKQTPEICLAAVTQYGKALWFVKKQTDEICIAALNQNFDSHNYINSKNWTSSVREEILKNHQ